MARVQTTARRRPSDGGRSDCGPSDGGRGSKGNFAFLNCFFHCFHCEIMVILFDYD